uniref:Uncharacterized protein n=1 Tax=Arundo donax TaxID=35708 RepID=A0A0A8ZDF9_ARUDO
MDRHPQLMLIYIFTHGNKMNIMFTNFIVFDLANCHKQDVQT